uniref:Latexin n=1 Tax=Fundulus heteroclitus TaxID=8078 RepID=A0A3Q2NZQ6_FUNHE
MGLRGVIVLVGLMGTTWSFNATTIRPEAVSTDTFARPETTEETTEQGRNNPGLMNEDRTVHVTASTDTSGGVDSQTTEATVGCSKKGAVAEEEAVEDVMATGELNPSHYPAQRAAKVVQHYLNTRYGSPYKLFGLKQVQSGNAEDVADSGRKYQLDISVHEIISDTKENCSAEVFFPRGVKQLSPQVQVSSCEELLKIDANSEEEALYQQYKTNKTLRTEKRLPDSYGHIDPEMTPFWHLGIVASSFIMLNESTENTLYNVAQVANITQLTTENDQLKFDCHVLLHDMVSQEIPQWKMLFTWSPAGGVKVLHTEQLPHVHDCEKHPKTN